MNVQLSRTGQQNGLCHRDAEERVCGCLGPSGPSRGLRAEAGVRRNCHQCRVPPCAALRINPEFWMRNPQLLRKGPWELWHRILGANLRIYK